MRTSWVSNARNNVGLAADYARNVGAVFGIVGKHVLILVRIVVDERNLVAVINVAYLEVGRRLDGVGRRKGGGNFGSREEKIVGVGLALEHFVAAVEARVEYGDGRPLTRVAHAARVEDTRVVHVNVVFNGRAFHCAALGAVVGVRKRNLAYARSRRQFFEVAECGGNRNGVEHGGITVVYAVYETEVFERGNERSLRVVDDLGANRACRGSGVFGKGHGGSEFVVSEIFVDDGVPVEGDYRHDFIVVPVAVVL